MMFIGKMYKLSAVFKKQLKQGEIKKFNMTNVASFATQNDTFNDYCSFNIIQPTVKATLESSRTLSETRPWWTLRDAWDHCLVGRSNDAQASASSQTA